MGGSQVDQQALRWGILGPGNIAKKFATGLQQTDAGTLVAVASRDAAKARAFAEEFGPAEVYGSYQALLADPNVDAVYIATPHPFHPQWTIAACEAGKHVLVEKPIALTAWQTEAMLAAADENDVFLMEAFMYRCHPQIARVVELIKSGEIGDVRAVQASFAFRGGDNPNSRLMNQDLGGGGILDVGGYPVSFARLVAGAASGELFADPVEVVGLGHVGETGIDEYCAAILKFPNGVVGEVATGVRLGRDNNAIVFGTKGSIRLNAPWLPHNTKATIEIRSGGETRIEEPPNDRNLYALEAEAVAAHIADRQAPQMSWSDTLGQMRTLDKWREAVGVTYAVERAGEGERARGGKLAPRSDASIPRIDVPGVPIPMSLLVMGCDNQLKVPHGDAMWDDWIERGGNAFDCAHGYGGGKIEANLGQWMAKRGIRDQVVMIGKGAHTPNCYPDKLTSQLHESLERMQTDHVEIYFMHRDNLEVPVGEFVDVLNEHADAGRIGIFGGSNWTLERVKEANAYAAANGKRGFTALSNNFSFADMVNPVWAGCVASRSQEWRDYLTETQIVSMPWSSQARGFFARASRDFLGDQQLVNSWYSDENFARLERARELAEERRCAAINIALAWILNQPFPVLPLVGPHHISETRQCLEGLDIKLTPEEVVWLDVGGDKPAAREPVAAEA